MPEGNEQVIGFINEFLDTAGETAKEQDIVYTLFRSGYCFYFAHMLKAAFNRGRLCVAAPFGHIVWVDEDEIPYDIGGVCDSNYEFLIPIEELGDGIEDFMHVPGKTAYCNEEQVNAIMQKYRTKGGN